MVRMSEILTYHENLHQTRNKSIHFFMNECSDEHYSLIELFILAEELINQFDLEDDFLRIIGMISTKGFILAKSMYSVILDGYGQEAGALLRPLVETIELIAYLNEDHSRLKQVFEESLPTAGKRAMKIDSIFHGMRKYLNENSSHVSISYHSMMHILDIKNNALKYNQEFNEKVFKENIRSVKVVLFFLLIESSKALASKDKLTSNLAIKIHEWREQFLGQVK